MTDSAVRIASPSVPSTPQEVARFSALAAEWWDPKGKFGVLHKFNPVRLGLYS
jgi:2-polyprenyl-6-hydroxyphenyl methylase/3-demethylubiquinone-9 3-methyltransferase